MGKRTTKADLVLREAQERVEKANHKVQECLNALESARAVQNAHTEAYYALERSLAPKPRVTKSSSAPSAAKRSSRKSGAQLSIANTEGETGNASTAEMCGVCGNTEGYLDHFQPSPSYHKFDSGKKSKVSAA